MNLAVQWRYGDRRPGPPQRAEMAAGGIFCSRPASSGRRLREGAEVGGDGGART
jgi:hypothetical protein